MKYYLVTSSENMLFAKQRNQSATTTGRRWRRHRGRGWGLILSHGLRPKKQNQERVKEKPCGRHIQLKSPAIMPMSCKSRCGPGAAKITILSPPSDATNQESATKTLTTSRP